VEADPSPLPTGGAREGTKSTLLAVKDGTSNQMRAQLASSKNGDTKTEVVTWYDSVNKSNQSRYPIRNIYI